MFSLALVSYSSIPICSANFCASSVETTFLSGLSFLLPTKQKDTIKLTKYSQLLLTQYSVDNVTILINFLKPSLHIHKRIGISDIIHNYHTVSPSIIPIIINNNNNNNNYNNNNKTHVEVIVLNLSCPAVSQICNFTFSPLTSIVRILKSTPIVVIYVPVHKPYM